MAEPGGFLEDGTNADGWTQAVRCLHLVVLREQGKPEEELGLCFRGLESTPIPCMQDSLGFLAIAPGELGPRPQGRQ